MPNNTSITISKLMAKRLDEIKEKNPGRFGSRGEIVKFIINDFLGRNFGYKNK